MVMIGGQMSCAAERGLSRLIQIQQGWRMPCNQYKDLEMGVYDGWRSLAASNAKSTNLDVSFPHTPKYVRFPM